MKRLLISLFLFLPTAGICTELPEQIQNELVKSHSINNAHKLSESVKEEAAAREMRLKALSVEAYSWGIQEAVYFRTNEIQDRLEQNSFTLNKVINMNKFIVDGKVLMPTVLESERMYIKNHDREARSVNTSYTLDKLPRIVNSAPTWRDYLKRSVPKPIKPIEQAFPKNPIEIETWDREFKRGWEQGLLQAESMFESDLNRLQADITGMYRFRFLLAQNIVTLPKMTKNENSVMLLDSGKTINLNDVKFTITLDAKFNKVSEWEPVFNKGAAHGE